MSETSLRELNRWIDVRDGVTAFDIVRRIISRSCKCDLDSLGNSWNKFEDLHTNLGSLEFEVFIQANVDAKVNKIESRGFYPSILVDDNSVDIYSERREGILKAWLNPSARYRDKFFTSMHPTELEITQEYISRLLRHGEADYVDCIASMIQKASPYWLLSRYNVKDLKDLISATQYREVLGARARSLHVEDERRLWREGYRAQIDACITIAQRNLRDKGADMDIPNPSQYFPPHPDRSEMFLVQAVGAQILKAVGTSKPGFTYSDEYEQFQ